MSKTYDLIKQLAAAAEAEGLKVSIDIQAKEEPKTADPVPDSWEGLEFKEEYQLKEYDPSNSFITYELAQSVRAISKLAKLMYKTWDNDGGWRPEEGEARYSIEKSFESLEVLCWSFSYHFLQFRTYEIAQSFLDKHRALIDQAAPILFGRVTQ